MLDKYKDFTTLQIEQEGRLLSVTLNRPETLNAVGGGMHEHLEELWTVIRGDNSVGAVLLTKPAGPSPPAVMSRGWPRRPGKGGRACPRPPRRSCTGPSG